MNLSELIAEHRIRIARDSRVYGGDSEVVCRCGKFWEGASGLSHMLCLWMYHQRGEILKAVFRSGESLEEGDGLTCEGYLGAERVAGLK